MSRPDSCSVWGEVVCSLTHTGSRHSGAAADILVSQVRAMRIFLSPPQYDGGDWSCVCSAQSSEESIYSIPTASQHLSLLLRPLVIRKMCCGDISEGDIPTL